MNTTTWTDIDAANKADGHYARRARPEWLVEAQNAARRAWAAHDAAVSAYIDGEGTIEEMHHLLQVAVDLQARAYELGAAWMAGETPASVQVANTQQEERRS